MKTTKTPWVILLFIILSGFLCSCEKGNYIPDLEGNLVGYVYTFDEFANQLDYRSDILITAYGFKKYKTYTDNEGRFEFKHLPAGTYELQFSKHGFCTLKQFGIKHLGGTPTTLGLSFSSGTNGRAFFIYQPPKTGIIDLSVENDTLIASFTFKTAPTDHMSLQVYLSDVPGFTRTNAKYSLSCYLRRTGEEFRGALKYSTLNLEHGSKIYFKACILNRRTSSVRDFDDRLISGIDSWFDYSTYTTVYPNLGNESDQFSFIVP